MDGHSISQAARRSGFPASTLRFYEDAGLVTPGRTPAGYRCYSETDVERLAFIGRAKGFGLSLEDIAELLDLLDGERCGPVQARLHELVEARMADARARIAELDTFADELQRVTASLGDHTPDGPCDDGCGCTVDAIGPTPAKIGRRPAADPEPDADRSPPIACTLGPEAMGSRLDEWDSATSWAIAREPRPGGARLRFPRDVDVAALAALVAAEQDCCRFLTFDLHVGADEVALDVTAPPDAAPIVDALVAGSAR